jgi:cytoskeletal protein CcmA (bactofilin family)
MSKSNFLKLAVLAAAFMFLPFSAAQAYAVRTGESIYIPKDQAIDGNLYAAGSNLTIDGEVRGDVICVAGQSITINAKVTGDVICFGQSLTINGEVGGNVRVAGNNVIINNIVGRNVNVAGTSLILGKDAKIGWDVLLTTANGEIRGEVGGSVYGVVRNLVVAGKIVKNLDIDLSHEVNKKKANSLEITSESKILGDINYTANKDLQLNKDNVNGKITRNIPKKQEGNLFLAYLISRLFAIFSALIVGLVLVSLWRNTIIKVTDKMKEKIWPSLGWGAVLLIITPVICILLAVTIIGIPLALILGGLWLLANFACKIITAVLVGRLIFKHLKQKESEKLLLEMTVGVVVCWLLFSIPFVGWALSLIAILVGLGASWIHFRKISA